MFPFDAERALAGEPLICRDGTRPGVAFRSSDETHPIRVVMRSGVAPYFTIRGKIRLGEDHHFDLFMLEEKPWSESQRVKWLVKRIRNGYDDSELVVRHLEAYANILANMEACKTKAKPS